MSAVRRDSIGFPEMPSGEKRRRRPFLRPKRKKSDPNPWRRSIILMVIIGALLLLSLTRYALEASLSFQLQEDQRKLQEALQNTERLRMENHREKSLETLENRAQKLGFRKPNADQYVYLVR